jgi:hypothetical protein
VKYGDRTKFIKESIEIFVRKLKIKNGIITWTSQPLDSTWDQKKNIDNLKDLVAEYLADNTQNQTDQNNVV